MKRLTGFFKFLAFPVYSAFSKRIGFSVFIPSLSGWWLYTRGKFFPIKGKPGVYALEYFRYFVPDKGDVVFDVGGEFGWESRQLARMVGREGRVFSFECFPEHVIHLRKLAKEYQNIEVIDKACWNQAGALKFFTGHTPGSNTALAGIKGLAGQPLANEKLDTITVEALTLDEMWKTYANGVTIGFLKMDIEGAEWEALEGASELLKKTKRIVVAAYHEREGKRTAPKVSRLLADAGFKVFTGDNLHVYAHRE